MLRDPVRVADLPWYDFEEVRSATDAWWRGIAGHLRRLGVDRVPGSLSRAQPHSEHWRLPNLLLSQACGYDVLYDAADSLRPVATPCYSARGCVGPRYRSELVVREDLAATTLACLRGRRVVVNEVTSHSGNNALRPLIAPLAVGGAFFGEVQVSGSHVDSLRAVQQGRADAACVDVVVMDLLARVRPQALRGTCVLLSTAPALAPPYVTSVHTEPALRRTLREALHAAAGDPALAECRRTLLLEGFQSLPEGAYGELAAFEVPAVRAGYHELPAPQRSPLGRPVASRSPRGSCTSPRDAV